MLAHAVLNSKVVDFIIGTFSIYLPLKNLNENFERVVLASIYNPDLAQYDIMKVIKFELAIEDLCLKYDYSAGTRYVVDMNNMGFGHITKMNPILLTKHISVLLVN